MRKLSNILIEKPSLTALLCATGMLLWFAQLKISFVSEDLAYLCMTAVVVLLMAAVSLPRVFASRGRALLHPTPPIFAALLSAAGTPWIMMQMTRVIVRVCVYVGLFLLFWLFFAGFRLFLSERKALTPATTDPRAPRRAFCMTFLLSMFGLLLLWWLYPTAMSPDSWNQWRQIHGEIPYTNIHAVAHTILLRLLCAIYDSFALAVLLNLVLVALVYALFVRLLVQKGASPGWMYVLISLSICNEFCSRVYIFPWKDTPYTFCIAMATYAVIRLIDRAGRVPLGAGAAIGAALAFIYLFRLNGVIAAAAMAVVFVYWMIRAKKIRSLAALLLTAAFCILGVQVCADRILKVEKPANGFSIQVFASGVAAVVANNGNITPEQQSQIDAMYPVDWMKSHYSPWQNSGLIWKDDGDPKFDDPAVNVFNNNFVLALGEHKAETIRLYFSLLPHNLGLCIRDVLYNTYAVWGYDTERFYDYNVFWLSVLLFAVLTVWQKKRGDLKYLAVFLGIVMNALSIAISTITNEKRYVLATFLLAPLLLGYVVSRSREISGSEDDPAPRQL